MKKFLISLCLIVVLVTIYNTTGLLGKLGVIYFAIAFILPLSFRYMINSIGGDKKPYNVNLKNPNAYLNNSISNNKDNIQNKNMNNSNLNSDIINVKSTKKPKYKFKKIDNEYYQYLKTKISTCSKNKVFSRLDILKLKAEINNLLDEHIIVYDGFTFENDLHEIYIKLKSSKLQDKDYVYLSHYVDEIINSKAEDVVSE